MNEKCRRKKENRETGEYKMDELNQEIQKKVENEIFKCEMEIENARYESDMQREKKKNKYIFE